MQRLTMYDDPFYWEHPEGFDYEREQRNFFAAKDRLQYILRCKLTTETGCYIQDASFHSCIKLGGDLLNKDHELSQIRFSNFGHLVAFMNEENIKETVKIDIIQHLVNLGYKHIPENYLHRQYTGSNRGVYGIDTWWTRYFDWV